LGTVTFGRRHPRDRNDRNGLVSMTELHATAPAAAEEPGELQQDELDQLVEQLQAEEIQSEDARLSSVASLQAWIMAHPALRQMQVFDHLHQIGPALLEVIKRLLGV
jgi:hypothetical protein